MDLVWGIFLYSLVNGMGFDISHSITNTGTYYYSKEKCLSSAETLNKLPAKEKQIGLDREIRLRYVCIAIPNSEKSV